MKKNQILILTLILFSLSLKADEVSVAFGEKLPPFVMPELNSGIEVDIVREALAVKGHVLKAVYMPMARIPIAFKNHKVDVVMMDVGVDMDLLGGYYGNPPVLYDNVFITLRKKKIVIKRPEDLIGLRINSFIGAQKRYPLWLGKLSADHYIEKNDQSSQPMLLSLDRFDVILCDRNIFKYYSIESQKKSRFKNFEVEEHSFVTVNPQDYRPVFYNKKIRDDFNLGLKSLTKSGRIKAIYDSYLKKI
ncbi:transporter substrate-binding domain-containing protein [Bacteriovorax sp. PP10]|uniref:Transporter substrate-binding domain-containing protein n=1 Tax=Bacteriovorax antarcticus TaxID=3088717 RepID=A0ABU5VW67_9BACT|nr:transporter substrate-binding domain-containing protein [Bacteriovorax sp. PP10]MEA9357292.1 transporter substrate-binding domain-containing protein [Bacteriovorax sp. PP10]